VDDAQKALLNSLSKRLEEDLNLAKKLSEMTDEARLALGLSASPATRAEELVRIRVLETITADFRNVFERISTVSGCCTAWIEINSGGRLVCELDVKHDGPHQKKLLGRADKQRIDVNVSWVMESYIKAV
jgi:hypothetical protein